MLDAPSSRSLTAVNAIAVELTELLPVIVAGADQIPDLLCEPTGYFLPGCFDAWRGMVAGTFTAFFTFISFEDIVNMAEEVKKTRPKTTYGNIPRPPYSFLVGSLVVAFALLFPLLALARIIATAVLAVFTRWIQRCYDLNWRGGCRRSAPLSIPLSGAGISSAHAIIQWWP